MQRFHRSPVQSSKPVCILVASCQIDQINLLDTQHKILKELQQYCINYSVYNILPYLPINCLIDFLVWYFCGHEWHVNRANVEMNIWMVEIAMNRNNLLYSPLMRAIVKRVIAKKPPFPKKIVELYFSTIILPEVKLLNSLCTALLTCFSFDFDQNCCYDKYARHHN